MTLPVPLSLPRLVFGRGALMRLPEELAALGVARPLLVSDRGIAATGIVEAARSALPKATVLHLDAPENPTCAGVDDVIASYRRGRCDGMVALGGGSVLDAAKIAAAIVLDQALDAAAVVGRPEKLPRAGVPLVAVPTTIGTGSESSPAASIHPAAGELSLGTRSTALVPRLAVCDPDLARTLPPRLVAATGIDALAHCIEGFLANPPHPLIDAIALDGMTRIARNIVPALAPEGEEARGELMIGAYAGGVAIHKGLGPAHAIALSCGDQEVHHGVIVAAALPTTLAVVAPHVPNKMAQVATVLNAGRGADVPAAITELVNSLGLPTTLTAAGYRPVARSKLLDHVLASPFHRTCPYVPTRPEYDRLLGNLLA